MAWEEALKEAIRLPKYTGSTSEVMMRILHSLRFINLRTKSGQRQYQAQITSSHNQFGWVRKARRKTEGTGDFGKVCNFSLPHRLRVARRRILRQDSDIASWASRVFPKRFL